MHVDILAAGDCPHCQHLREAVEARFGECCCVDTHRHPEALRRFNLEASPVVVVDGRVYAGDDQVLALLREHGSRLA